MDAPDWQKRLRRELRSARRLFVLGVGNREKADDGVGCLCAQLLKKKIRKGPDSKPLKKAARQGLSDELAMEILDGGEVPESATGIIRRFRPTHVLIMDAATGGHEPGTIFFIKNRKIAQEDVSTHRIPLSQLVRYLEESVGCRVILVGIEPADISWRKPMSRSVRKSAAVLVNSLLELWRKKITP
jgi:hydrogenase 3 maturation protease